MKYFGGIEGGATHSHLVICDENGQCKGETSGLGTNHWMVGIQECAHRIADMVERAKYEAGLPAETPLTSLGLSLSGCEQEATNRELEHEIRTSYPTLAENYFLCSDTLGSMFTASGVGGMVVISGTGSNALLRNVDGSTHNCGGWGNYLGDEGSAWYISHRAMKIVFDHMDDFERSPYPVERTWELIRQHFNVETRMDLLTHCYAKFDKPFFAGLCKKLAKAAEEGDPLAVFLFREAGQHIARHVQALVPKVEDSLLVDNALSVVCVGSVWKSWPLIKEGFVEQMDSRPLDYALQLIRVTKPMSYGACYLGADAIKFPLPRNYTDNFELLYMYYNQCLCNGKATNGK